MEHPGFFDRNGPFTLKQVAEASEAEPAPGTRLDMTISGVLPLDEAGDGHVSFFDNPKYLKTFMQTKAAACFVAEKYSDRTPEGTVTLLSKEPYRSFALALTLFYPSSLRPYALPKDELSSFSGGVHRSAKLEKNVTVEPGAYIAPEAGIGEGTTIAGGAYIGHRVQIGRNCHIGPNAVVTNALIGNGVVLHPGTAIGQDGFGFAMGPSGHLKVPQIGRVVIQDNVEIGAGTTIDRGALKDTIIGEGTKIDNLVQIGHNVVVGRHCVIVSQVGIAGSVTLGDGVVIGGQAGIAGHVKVGSGAQIAATSSVRNEIPDGGRWGGTPARPISVWFREIALVQRLAEERAESRRKKST